MADEWTLTSAAWGIREERSIASQTTDLIETDETLNLSLNTSRIDRWTFAGLLLSSNSR
jgi:hypothetical protein